MKVLHILFSNKFAGAEKNAIDIIKHSPHNIEGLYLSYDGDIRNQLNQHKIKYILLNNITVKKIYNIINEYKIDLIHAHDFKASLIASFFSGKIKVISHIHQSPSWINNSKNLRYIFYKFTIKKYSKIFVTSKDILDSKLFDTEKSLLLPNYVPVNERYMNKAKEYDFIFVGRLEEIKNPIKFIELVYELSKKKNGLKAAIVGDGSLKSDIKEIIDKSKINIKYLGFQDDAQYYIAKSTFLINTSDSEGFGIASIEAMRLGVPVITTRNGGISDELIDMKNGIILSNNISKDVSKIISVFNDRELFNKIRQNSIDFSAKFGDKNKWINKITQFYN